jgi:hypothetical protein
VSTSATATTASVRAEQVRAERLSLGLPPGLTGPAENLDGAVATYRGTPPAEGGPQPLVALFVERRAVGSLDLRTELLTEVRSAQVGVKPTGPPRDITVPGAVGAQVVEWRWTYPARGSLPSGSVRLVEVVLQTAGPDQYGVKFVGAAPFVTDDAVNGLLASLRIDTAPAGGAA